MAALDHLPKPLPLNTVEDCDRNLDWLRITEAERPAEEQQRRIDIWLDFRLKLMRQRRP